MLSKQYLDFLGTHFARLNRENTFGGTIHRSSGGTKNIGSPDAPWDNIYANSVIASIVVGQMTGSEWEAIGNMYIDAHSATGDTTLYVVNQDGTFEASLNVEKDIVVGGTVDGVDVGNFNNAQFLVLAASSYTPNERVATAGDGIDFTDGGAGGNLTIAVDYGTGLSIATGALIHDTGDLGDLHTNYAEHDGAETITGLWTFDRDPSAPFAVSASSAVVTNLDADKIDGYQGTEIAILAENESITGTWNFPATGFTIGTDVALSRSAADVLYTPDSIYVGKIGIGAAPTYPLDISYTHSHTSGYQYGVEIDITMNGGGSASLMAFGMWAYNTVATTGDMRALYAEAEMDANVANIQVVTAALDLDAGTTGDIKMFRSVPLDAAGVVATNLYHVYLETAYYGAGTYTNEYGIYVEHIHEGATLNYAIYTNEGNVSFGDDLEFRQAAEISTTTGNLTIGPAGDITLDPAGDDVLPGTKYMVNLGSLQQKYLTLHCAELWVETLVAQDTIATIGGRILVGPTTILESDMTTIQTYMTVKHNQMTDEDIVHMEAYGKVEFIRVDGYTATATASADTFVVSGVDLTSLLSVGDYFTVITGPNADEYTVRDISFSTNTTITTNEDITSDGTTDVLLYEGRQGVGPYTYLKVERNIDLTGGNEWWAGDAVFNTRQSGDGFIDIYSIDGVADETQYGPTIVGNVRTGSTYNGWVEHWAIGNLNGVYGYSTNDIYGVGLGRYETGYNNIVIDPTDGIRFRDYNTVTAQWDGTTITLGDASTENVYITSSGVYLRDGTTAYTSMIAGTLYAGNTSAEHVEVGSTNGVRIMDGTTCRGQWDTDGNILIGYNIGSTASTALVVFAVDSYSYNSETFDQGDILIGENTITKANIFWDKSEGTLNFRAGAAAAKVYINTTGQLIAGAGSVTLDDSGISISYGTGDANELKYYYSTTKVGSMSVFQDTAAAHMTISVLGPNITYPDGILTLSVDDYLAGSYMEFVMDSSTGIGQITGEFYINSDCRIGGGLHVGNITTDPNTDYITADGSILSANGLTAGSTTLAASTGSVRLVNTSGDAFVYFDGTFDWSAGIDYSDSHAFKISMSGSVGTNEYLKFDTNGYWYKGGLSTAVSCFVPLTTPITHTSFNGDTFSDVSTSTKIENTSWSTAIPSTATALLLQILITESGTISNGLYFSAGPSTTYYYAASARPQISGVQYEIVSPVPCSYGDIWYRINTTGTSTMTVYLRVWGYWI